MSLVLGKDCEEYKVGNIVTTVTNAFITGFVALEFRWIRADSHLNYHSIS